MPLKLLSGDEVLFVRMGDTDEMYVYNVDDGVSRGKIEKVPQNLSVLDGTALKFVQDEAAKYRLTAIQLCRTPYAFKII